MLDAGRFAPTGVVRAAGYRLLWMCADALQRAANACLYLAAGLLRRDELDAASRLRWRGFGLSIDDVSIGLDASERRLYGDHLRPSDRVLLVGSGTGRDLVGLLELGCDVTGLEQAPELVEISRTHLARRGLSATVVAGSVDRADVDGAFDAVVFSPGVYSCLHPLASRVATLARLRARLSKDGRMLISYSSFAAQSPWTVRLTRASARLTGADWRPEPGDSFSRDRIAGRVLRYEHVFHPGDVARECAAAGLRVVQDEAAGPPFRCAVAVPVPVAAST
jgi:SAM-dependent methyltransferase